jgi:hypothetical protein
MESLSVHLSLLQDQSPRPSTMPTLRSLHGDLITLGDGPRALRLARDLTRDLETCADTADLMLDAPPRSPISLGIITTRLAPALTHALHAALDAATSADVIDLSELLAEVARAEALR